MIVSADAYRAEPFGDACGFRSVSTVNDMGPAIRAVTEAMSEIGFPDHDVFAVRLAMEEAVVNSLKHGHRFDPTKRVSIRYRIDPERVLVEVHDQGPGFNPQAVADPTSSNHLDRPNGRGVFLMRRFLTWVHFNERGNSVTLCRQRSVNLPE